MLPKAEGKLIYTDKPVNLSKSAAILDKLMASQTEMIKLQMNFRERSLTVFIAFAVYLAVDVILGKALANFTTFFLLKTIIAFALVGLIWQLLMNVKNEGNGKRAAVGQL